MAHIGKFPLPHTTEIYFQYIMFNMNQMTCCMLSQSPFKYHLISHKYSAILKQYTVYAWQPFIKVLHHVTRIKQIPVVECMKSAGGRAH